MVQKPMSFIAALALLAVVVTTRAAVPFPDFDGDGTVGFGDFVKFSTQFGFNQGDDGYDERYDLNGDGSIGFADFAIFAQHFGKDVTSDDRAVLVALYHATDGLYWHFSTNWLSDRPLGEWYGVTTDRTGRVEALHLHAIESTKYGRK